MRTPFPPDLRSRAPMWSRGPKILQAATATVIVLAIAVDLVILVRAASPAGSWVALALTAAGVGIGYRRPYVGLVLIAASPLTASLSGAEPIFYWSIACFAAFLFTLRGLPGLLTGVVIGAANLIAAGLASGSIAPSVDPGASIGAFVALVASAAGSAILGHGKYWFELEQRTQEAIATRQAAVNRSVAEERVRIARDLHDSVGHKIAVVSMHLGAAQVHLPPDAVAARADLESARAGVQSVLRETQQILRVLRVGADGSTLAPTPQHGHIPDLVESYRTAGLTIEASLPDLSRPLGPTASAAAYRITQEALTNAQRHGTGVVSLHIEISDESAVVIEVVNVRRPTAAGRETSDGRQGLVGMRERAESAGGQLDVRIDEKLFWVRAELPANDEVDT